MRQTQGKGVIEIDTRIRNDRDRHRETREDKHTEIVSEEQRQRDTCEEERDRQTDRLMAKTTCSTYYIYVLYKLYITSITGRKEKTV